MMLSRSLSMSFFIAVVFLFSSCSGSEKKTGTDTASSDTTTTTTTATAATTESVAPSTIVTSPQVMLLVKHKVANFTKWKPSYDAHDSMRLANGIHSYVIGRGVQDSNMVFVVTKADDAVKAKAFAQSPSLKAAMQKSGVAGKPSISFENVVWQDTAILNPNTIRSLTTFTVKDWDTWQAKFKEGKQERIDNGIADRVYGHEVDDNKKVMLVTAIMDSAKAAAYWKSDMLKQRRAAGGVIGVPDRFLFRVVQRY
ncbi:MAG: hypothetical protein ABIN01_22020 [Ferruginibacter sp.]